MKNYYLFVISKYFLVDLKSYQLINKIQCPYITTLYKISNEFVFSGQQNGDIKQWKCNGRDSILFSYKNEGHPSEIWSFFELNNIIFSGGQKGDIKFWE